MNKSDIEAARNLARQFIELIDNMTVEEKARGGYASPKHRGAVRRKSMDLTRALAELRNPRTF